MCFAQDYKSIYRSKYITIGIYSCKWPWMRHLKQVELEEVRENNRKNWNNISILVRYNQ